MKTVRKKTIKSLKNIILDEVSLVEDEDVLFLRRFLFKIDKEISKYIFLDMKSKLYDLIKKLSLELNQIGFGNTELYICEDIISKQLKTLNYIEKNFESLFEIEITKIKEIIEDDDVPF